MNATATLPIEQTQTGAGATFLPAVNLLLNATNFEAIEKVAQLMASGVATVPKHLQGNVSDCFAIAMQALQWGMNPFAVAPKTHNINGVIGYEGQLVNAVINTMAPTKDRIHYEWFGPWENVIGKFHIRKNNQGKEYRSPAWELKDEAGCGIRVWATLKGEDSPRELVLYLAQARTRNSTLWADDPRQQLAYLAVKRWARLYCPDVIMGVYTKDELEDYIAPETEINPEFKAQAATEAPKAPPAEDPACWPAPAFERQFAKWEVAIKQGRCSHADCIKVMTEKAPLSQEQLNRINSVKAPIEGEATPEVLQ